MSANVLAGGVFPLPQLSSCYNRNSTKCGFPLYCNVRIMFCVDAVDNLATTIFVRYDLCKEKKNIK